MTGGQYRLFRGNRLLGTITRTEDDPPWFNGVFDPAPDFEEFKPLFEQELKMLENPGADQLKWEDVWMKIKRVGIRLVSADGSEEFSDFIIHIDGNEAWWK